MKRFLLLFMLAALGATNVAVTAAEPGEEDFLFARRLVVDRQEYDLAAKKFAEFVAQNPRSAQAPEALSMMGYCYSKLGKDGAAVESYGRLINEYPQADANLLQEALAYGGDACFKLKRFAEAEALYTQLIEKHPLAKLTESALYWRGETRYRQALAARQTDAKAPEAAAKLDQAITDFESFVRRYPESKRLPAALYSAAFAQYEQGHYAAAIEHFSRLVRDFPQDGRAEESQLYVAECLYQDQKYPRARQEYARVLELFKQGQHLSEARSGVAWCDYAEGRPLEAAKGFEEASALAGDNQDKALSARYDAGCAYREAGRFDEAVACLKPVAAEPQHNLRPAALFKIGAFRLEQAKALAGGGEPAADSPEALALAGRRRPLLQEAAESLKRALAEPKLGGQAAEAATFLGEAELDLGEYQAATEAFALIVKNWPTDERAPWALYHQALAFRELKQIEAARDALRRLFKEYPRSRLHLQAAYAVADYEESLGNKAPAREAYLYIVQQGEIWAKDWRDGAGRPDPELPAKARELACDSLYRLGESYYPGESVESAAKYYQLLVERYPQSSQAAMALLRLGEIAEAGSDLAGASVHYQAVVAGAQDGPAFRHAAYRLGVIELLRGQAEKNAVAKSDLLLKAKEYLDRFLTVAGEDDPQSAKAHYYRAEALYGLARQKEAQPDYETALQREPKGELTDATLFGLGWCRRDQGQAEAAREAFSRLAAEFPQSRYLPDALYVLGLDRYEAKDYAGALSRFETLLKAAPQSEYAPKALVEKARTLEATGDHAGAMAGFEQFLKTYPGHAETPRALYNLSWALWNLAEPRVEAARAAEAKWRTAAAGRAPAELDEAARARLKPLRDEADKLAATVRAEQEKLTGVLDRLVKEYPDFTDLDAVWLRLGEIAYDRQEYAPALEKYEQALNLAKVKKTGELADKALYRVAWCQLRLGEEEAAKAAGHALSAEAKNRKKQAILAFESLAQQYAKSPLAAESYFRAAELRREFSDYAGALNEYDRALRGAPESAFARAAQYGAGLCQLELKDYARALKSFKAFLDQHTEGDFVHEAAWGAGQACLLQGAYADAEEFFRRVVADDYPGEAAAKARYGLGLAAFSRKQWEKAREEFLKVEAFHGQWTEWASLALLKASDASLELGEKAKARKDLELILSRYQQTTAAEKAKAALATLGG